MKISYRLNGQDYYVHFLEKSYNQISKDLDKLNSDKKILFVYDNNISKNIINNIFSTLKFTGCNVYKLQYIGSKKNKNLKSVLKIIDLLIKEGFTKKSVILSLGGGVLSDLSGLAASLYMRGMLYFNIPSTMTAMIDSCIGGKTAVNYQNIINSIGTYHHAKNVYILQDLINCLPDREFYSGIPEIIKCGLIKKNQILKILEKKHLQVKKRESKIIKKLCLETLRTKIFFFKNDVYEKNKRLMLNFGHTFAHSIEMATAKLNSKNELFRHGEAVGIGMLCELNYALNSNSKISKKTKELLELYKLPVNLKSLTLNKSMLQNDIFKNLFLDKKKVSKYPRYINIKKIGSPKILEMKDYNKINFIIRDIL